MILRLAARSGNGDKQGPSCIPMTFSLSVGFEGCCAVVVLQKLWVQVSGTPVLVEINCTYYTHALSGRHSLPYVFIQ